MSTTITAGNATNNGASIASDTAGTIEIKTGSTPTTAITVDTSQNVGIGTASPTAKLTSVVPSIASYSSATQAWKGSNGTGEMQLWIANAAYAGVGANEPWLHSYQNINIGSDAAIAIKFQTSAAERMRIDSSGNVGIGTTTPSNKVLTVGGSGDISCAAGNGGIYFGDSGTPAGSNGFGYNAAIARAAANNYHISTSVAGDFCIAAEGTKNILFGTSTSSNATTERMRITSTGIACIGTTGSLDGQLSIYNPLATYCLTLQDRGTTGGIRFNNPSSTQVGAVYIGSSSTTYATTSDYRLKENVAPMTGALAKISALKPVTYTWKSTGNVGEGFIAHELAEVCPDAVAGEKDAVDEEGNPKYQGIDTSFLVATLTAAIQELNAKVDAQAAEIAALKGAK